MEARYREDNYTRSTQSPPPNYWSSVRSRLFGDEACRSGASHRCSWEAREDISGDARGAGDDSRFRTVRALHCAAGRSGGVRLEGSRRGTLLQWQPNLGTRIALIGLDGSPPTWLDTDAFFVFHFANAFERGDNIVIDYVRHEALGVRYAGAPRQKPTLHRLHIDLAKRTLKDAQIEGVSGEFPRINDGFNALPTRFVFLPTRTATLGVTNPPSATFNAILKVDAETGFVVCHDFGKRISGEATFIPRGANGEDDGYLALFTFDPVERSSDFVLLDAARLDAEPVAVVRLPQRVPQGLHGSWIPMA
jgi:carotenoid cleavage dioxygenase-like enzyme